MCPARLLTAARDIHPPDAADGFSLSRCNKVRVAWPLCGLLHVYACRSDGYRELLSSRAASLSLQTTIMPMNLPESFLIADLDELLELLRLSLLRLRHQLEIAEARVPRWNQLVQELWRAGLMSQTAILGRVLETRPYAPVEGGHSSRQVVQAALLIPGGVGVLHWDTEDFALHSRISDGLESHAWTHHVPFDRCEPAYQVLLANELPMLIGGFVRLLR